MRYNRHPTTLTLTVLALSRVATAFKRELTEESNYEERRKKGRKE
jgi:hypothetical protein